MEIAARSRNRFDKKPIISRVTHEPRPVTISDDDVKIFHDLAYHYHYLSPGYIAALRGRPYKSMCARTNQLRMPPAQYLKLCPEQENNPRGYYWGYLFYQNDKRALQVLGEHGYEPPKRIAPQTLKHQVMVDMIMASIEIGVTSNPLLELVWWEDMIESGRIPRDAKPYIELSDGKTAHPDRYPFAIKRNFEKPQPMFFLGYEAETGTHSFPDVRQKFANYIAVLKDELYKQQYGATTCYIPFFTPNENRLKKFMLDLEDMTADKPSLRKHFLFQTHPLFTSDEKPRATGHVVEEPCLRVGYPPLSINQPGV